MDTIELLRQLIARPSLTPKSAGCLELIAPLLTEAGFTLTHLPADGVDNLLAIRGDTLRLLFAGHVDVVPVGDLSQWRHDPFQPTEENGHLIGRGAADMKSGVAAMVAAATANKADGVGIFLTTDEEGIALSGTKHFVEWWQAQKHPPIPHTLVAEPTCDRVFGDSIKIGRRGSLTGRLRVHGDQQHAAYAHRGTNAAHRLINALHEIITATAGNIAAQAAGKSVTTFQVIDLRGGVGADNVTPPFIDAVINFRYAATDGGANHWRALVETALQTAAPDQWTCQWEHGAEPYLMSENGHLITALRQAITQHTGQTPALTSSGGASDGRFLKNISEETVEFGVCNTSIHAPNESVRIADVRALQAIYETIITHLCPLK